MSIKRSRQSESNFIEKDVLNHMSSPAESAREVLGAPSASEVMKPPPKCLKPTLDKDNKVKLWPNAVLASSSHGSINRGFGEFLKICHFCTKEIDQDKDLYMYRDWGAFCSEECRGYQMKLDKKFQEQYEKAKKAVAQDEEVKKMFH